MIKALEENGIPIDYVSGTSMGAIIAGLYAIGYTPEQMAEIFESNQIKYWMSGKIEDKYIYYFKQRRPNAAMITLRIDFRNPQRIAKLQLPTSLIQSEHTRSGFRRIFSGPSAQCGGDFDKLFVPFRCIATDAAARKEVVYRGGSRQSDPRVDDHSARIPPDQTGIPRYFTTAASTTTSVAGVAGGFQAGYPHRQQMCRRQLQTQGRQPDGADPRADDDAYRL
ncbi:MAG: patatin-like phospholipase family protein [Alistipes indistinctus]